jgi:hypothetical protein
VVLESFTFIGGRPDGSAGSGPMSPPSSGSVPGRVTGNRPAPAAPAPADAEGGPPDDDDVPF